MQEPILEAATEEEQTTPGQSTEPETPTGQSDHLVTKEREMGNGKTAVNRGAMDLFVIRCAERLAQKLVTHATYCLDIATMAETQTSSTSSVSCRNLQCVPNISFRDIEEFSSRCSAKRDHNRGYRYFAEKYIFNLQVAPNTYNDGYRATSRCYRSYRKSEILHTLEDAAKTSLPKTRQDKK